MSKVESFQKLINECESIEEVSTLCRDMLTLSAMMIRGIDGEQFAKDFLTGAINDKSAITPQRVN